MEGEEEGQLSFHLVEVLRALHLFAVQILRTLANKYARRSLSRLFSIQGLARRPQGKLRVKSTDKVVYLALLGDSLEEAVKSLPLTTMMEEKTQLWER